jgi:hypothetical protein
MTPSGLVLGSDTQFGNRSPSLHSTVHLISTFPQQISHLFRPNEYLGLRVDGKDEDIPKQMRLANRLIIRAVDK